MRIRPLTLVRVLAAGIALARIARAVRTVAPVRPTVTPPPSATGGITVVIPARDEARRIGPLLEAVIGAPGVDDVIVVDDGSSDATARVASDAGARVVAGAPLPDGWTGKAWALQQGIEAAATVWVVTLDADTRPTPDLPTALVSRAMADDLGVVTAAGSFECPTAGLRWLHPAMLTTLVYRFGPPGFEGPVRPGRAMANGQCMAVRRAAFLHAGGMAPVAGHPVEDVAIVRHLAAQGWRVAFLDASDELVVRMYESVGDAWRGWGRSLALPGVESPARQCADLVVVLVAQALPLPRLLVRRGDVLDVVLSMVRLGTLAGTRRSYRNDGRPGSTGLAYWLSPSADLPAAAALASGIVRRRQRWRGREYATPRSRPGRTAAR